MVGRNVGLALLAVLTIIILPVGANAASCESLKWAARSDASALPISESRAVQGSGSIDDAANFVQVVTGRI